MVFPRNKLLLLQRALEDNIQQGYVVKQVSVPGNVYDGSVVLTNTYSNLYNGSINLVGNTNFQSSLSLLSRPSSIVAGSIPLNVTLTLFGDGTTTSLISGQAVLSLVNTAEFDGTRAVSGFAGLNNEYTLSSLLSGQIGSSVELSNEYSFSAVGSKIADGTLLPSIIFTLNADGLSTALVDGNLSLSLINQMAANGTVIRGGYLNLTNDYTASFNGTSLLNGAVILSNEYSLLSFLNGAFNGSANLNISMDLSGVLTGLADSLTTRIFYFNILQSKQFDMNIKQSGLFNFNTKQTDLFNLKI